MDTETLAMIAKKASSKNNNTQTEEDAELSSTCMESTASTHTEYEDEIMVHLVSGDEDSDSDDGRGEEQTQNCGSLQSSERSAREKETVMEERLDEAYEFPSERDLYDLEGAGDVSVPSGVSSDPESKWRADPEPVATGVPVQTRAGSSSQNLSDDQLKKTQCRRVVSAPDRSLTPVMFDQLKDEYRRLPRPAEGQLEGGTSLPDGHQRIKEEYRRLPRPAAEHLERGTSLPDGHQRIKEEYRRLTRPAAGKLGRGSSLPQETDGHQRIKEEYRRLPRLDKNQTRGQGIPSNTSPNDVDPYANYNPYQPGAHTIPSIPSSNSTSDRPSLGCSKQYSSARTNADAYLVSAHLVKEKSLRFQQLEDRQTELERQIMEQQKVLAAHEEALSKLQDASGVPLTNLEVGSSHSRQSIVSSLSDSLVSSQPVQATVILAEEDLDKEIAQREERVRQREAELERLIVKTKRKSSGVKKLKRLITNPFRKYSSQSGSSASPVSNTSRVTETPVTASPQRSKGVEGFGDIDASRLPVPPLTDYSLGESGRTEAATFGSEDLSVGKESLSGGRLEEEKERKRLEKQNSFYAQPEKDVFNGFAVSELKALAAEYYVDICNCTDRIQIVDELTKNGVSPTSKQKNLEDPSLRSQFVSEGKKRSDRFVAIEKSPYDGISISDLKRMAAKANIDVSHCFDRTEIVSELRNGGVSPKAQKKAERDSPDEESASSNKFKMFGRGSLHGSNHSKGDTPSSNREEFANSGKKRSDRFIAPVKDAFDGFKISELKRIALEGGVDLSGCVERGLIVNKLLEAGVTPHKKHGLFGGIKKGVTYDNDAAAPKVVEGKKRAATYAAAPKPKDVFEKFSISQLKQLARDTDTDISSCVERRQICDALIRNGVTPGSSQTTFSPKQTSKKVVSLKSSAIRVGKSKFTLFHGYSVAQLKVIAREQNVDVSGCLEREDIVQKLKKAGVRKDCDKLTNKDFKGWNAGQLLVLASVIKVDLSNVDKKSRGDILGKILDIGNVKRPTLRSHLREITGWGSLSLSKLQKLARDFNVNIAHCVEKEEILRCLIESRCP